MPYTPRFAGPRWVLIYGSFSGIEAFAVEELHRMVQSFLPYVVEVLPAGEVKAEKLTGHVLLVGKPQDSPLLQEALQSQGLDLPENPEGYVAAGFASPWNRERRAVVIASRGESGVLYGVEEFNAQVLAARVLPEKITPETLRQAFDSQPDFRLWEEPRIEQRGIWTWGHVIYNYRAFLNRMARLRLNLITIWDDVPPVNCREVIDYAHSRGVKVFLGFPWGWGMDFDLTKPADVEKIRSMVVAHYRKVIAPLAPDGIYFQTLTEHNSLELGGKTVAKITCDLVNEIAAALYEVTPGLVIHFGLHATSIREHYSDLAGLDRRVSIVWEDAGVLPYTYLPTLQGGEGSGGSTPGNTPFEQTLDYSRRLAALRPGTPFGLVPKGWTNLDWPGEFEHHESFLLGVRTSAFIQKRLEMIQPRWERVNALWMELYGYGITFYKTMLKSAPAGMIVEGLIEDGLFEAQIQPAVALYAETLWNPTRPPEEILKRALSGYFKG